MGEDMRAVLGGRIRLVEHVQVADSPGRNEPGTGTIDWPATIRTLRELGYAGALGLEYPQRLLPRRRQFARAAGRRRVVLAHGWPLARPTARNGPLTSHSI